MEGDHNHYYSNPFYILPEIASDTLTDGIYGNKYIFAPYAQALTVAESDEVVATELLSTTESSYRKAQIADTESFEKAEGDQEGPFTLGLTAEKQLGEQVSVAAVFGSEALFTEDANEMVAGANLQLFSNVWSYLVEHRLTVSIPAKSLDSGIITVPGGTSAWISIALAGYVPLNLLIAGVVIWRRRRRR